eukprot:555672-Amphidinium_carterae.1
MQESTRLSFVLGGVIFGEAVTVLRVDCNSDMWLAEDVPDTRGCFQPQLGSSEVLIALGSLRRLQGIVSMAPKQRRVNMTNVGAKRCKTSGVVQKLVASEEAVQQQADKDWIVEQLNLYPSKIRAVKA